MNNQLTIKSELCDRCVTVEILSHRDLIRIVCYIVMLKEIKLIEQKKNEHKVCSFKDP